MSFLDRLDNYYNNRKASEVWMMVILTAILIGYILYLLLSDSSYKFREAQELKNSTLNANINSANAYLNSITVNGDRDFYIKDLSKKITEKRGNLNSYREKLSKLDGAVEKLNGVLYNNGNWSKFLHNIANKAEDNSLKIYNISNTTYDNNKSFGKVLDVNVKCEGKYGNILAFLNDLEKSQLVSNISTLKLSSTKENPIADFNLTVWGIKP